MDTLHQIEQAIDTLPPEQMEELYLWLDQKYQRLVDASLKADLEAGLFDQTIQRALEDEAAGRITPL